MRKLRKAEMAYLGKFPTDPYYLEGDDIRRRIGDKLEWPKGVHGATIDNMFKMGLVEAYPLPPRCWPMRLTDKGRAVMGLCSLKEHKEAKEAKRDQRRAEALAARAAKQ